MINDKLKTPLPIINALGGRFDLDPCAGIDTNIGYINICDDKGGCGLSIKWDGLVFCNPPFSKKQLWINKMIEHRNGILLLPERGSAPWFGELANECGKYFVLGKKINFIGGQSSNNVGSVLFPFGDEALIRIRKSLLPGHFVNVEWYLSRELSPVSF